MNYRQGEILILRVCETQRADLSYIAKDLDSYIGHLRKVKTGVIREGEQTGHEHKVVGDAELYSDDSGTMFLRVGSDNAKVTQQEHKAIPLKKGDYEIRIQREYDEQQDRYVVD